MHAQTLWNQLIFRFAGTITLSSVKKKKCKSGSLLQPSGLRATCESVIILLDFYVFLGAYLYIY